MEKPVGIYKNTILLSSLSVLERALGFFYRIVLARLLGAEGLGVYQIAVSHFFMLRTLGGGGIPVTLSRTVAKERANGKHKGSAAALAAALLLSLCITLPLTLFFLIFSGKIPAFQADGLLFKILVISLPFACAYAAVKGFFWGNKEFLAPALFEFFEEIFMTALGSILLIKAGSFTPTQGAVYAAVAMSASCVFSCIVALFALLKRKVKFAAPTPYLKPLFLSSLPITAMRSGSTLVGSAVAVLLPAMLVATGNSEAEALAAFGVATGMVLPLLTMPMTVIGSLATVLIPELSEAYAKREQKKLANAIEKGLTFSALLACLLLPVFTAVGYELGCVTYKNTLAGEMLSKTALLLLPMSLCAVAQSMVNSLGFEKQSFLFSCVGSAVFLLCIFLLPKFVGIYAYPIGLGIEFTVCALLSLFFLAKHCSIPRTFYQKLLGALALTMPLGLFGKTVTRLCLCVMGEPFALILAALLTVAVTVGLFAAFGLLQKRELKKFF